MDFATLGGNSKSAAHLRLTQYFFSGAGNFTAVDERLFEELETPTAEGLRTFRESGFIAKKFASS